MTDSTLLFTGILLGGLVIAGIGALVAYMNEKKMPSMKSVVRDFIIGGVLMLLVLQLVPDTFESAVSNLPNMKDVFSGVSGANEMEIQVGLPRF